MGDTEADIVTCMPHTVLAYLNRDDPLLDLVKRHHAAGLDDLREGSEVR